MQQNSSVRVCLVGDFNAVRSEFERAGRGLVINRRDMLEFDSFIRSSGMCDLPLHRRFFTWYRADGSCKSKLDRMLLNDHWMDRWPNALLKGVGRTVSDHCPLVLETVVRDWGPKLFRSIDAWFSHPDSKEFIFEKWRNYTIQG